MPETTIDATISILEIVLRFLSAFTLTLAAFGIFHYLPRFPKRTNIVWKYVGIIVGVTAIWRWFVVLLIRPDLLPHEVSVDVLPWVNPVTQSLFTLIGIAFLLLISLNMHNRDGDGT